MAIEIKHLRHFLVVAEEGHITRAAERLGMQQPPLSQRISSIERELKVQLFHRRARGVELSEAGRIFLDHVRSILAQYDRSFEATRRAARGEQGALNLGISPTGALHSFIPLVVRNFRQTFPLVSMKLEEQLTIELIERLGTGQLDVAFLRTENPNVAGLSATLLIAEPMVVAVPSTSRLGSGSRPRGIELRDLAAEDFIFYAREQGVAFYQATLAACLNAGFNPRIVQEAPRITLALSLVAVGMGICIVPASMRRLNLDGVVYRALCGPVQPVAPLHLTSRRNDASPVVRQFLSLAKRTAKDWR